MSDTAPLITTRLHLTRLLKGLAMRLGLDDTMADAVAQVHLQQERGTKRWDEFYRKNCSSCLHSPDSCPFFSPSEEQCHPGVGPAQIQQGNVLMIETGRFKECPVKKPETPV